MGEKEKREREAILKLQKWIRERENIPINPKQRDRESLDFLRYLVIFVFLFSFFSERIRCEERHRFGRDVSFCEKLRLARNETEEGRRGKIKTAF